MKERADPSFCKVQNDVVMDVHARSPGRGTPGDFFARTRRKPLIERRVPTRRGSRGRMHAAVRDQPLALACARRPAVFYVGSTIVYEG